MATNLIANRADALAMLSAENEQQASRNLYKYTECGAWVEFDSDGVRVGSIVEGSDEDCTTHTLRYPFTASAFDKAVAEIEAEADALWKEANGEDDE